MNFAERIKKLRKKKDWTQLEFGEKFGKFIGIHPFAQVQINRWESGKFQPNQVYALNLEKFLKKHSC